LGCLFGTCDSNVLDPNLPTSVFYTHPTGFDVSGVEIISNENLYFRNIVSPGDPGKSAEMEVFRTKVFIDTSVGS